MGRRRIVLACIALACAASGGCGRKPAPAPPSATPATIPRTTSAADPLKAPLRPDDVVQVEVLGQPELNRTAVVRPDGKVALVLLGDVVVAEMTPPEVTEKLTRLYSEYLVGPCVTVTAVRMSSEGGHIPGKAEHEDPVRGRPEMTIMEEIDRRSAEAPASAQTKPDPATDGAWGQVVRGVQVRLVADRSQWKAGEAPTLVVEIRDLRHRGLGLIPEPGLERLECLEIDGIPYTRNSEVRFNVQLPRHGAPPEGIVIALDPEKWGNEGKTHPDLKPGKHTVRATLTASVPRVSADDDALIPGPSAESRSVTLMSRLVEIEILAPDEE